MKLSKVWLSILVLMLAMGLVFTSACCKKKAPEVQPAATDKGISEDELAAKKKAEAEALLKKQQLQKFVNEDVYFDFDDAALRTDAKATLKDKADYMKANPNVNVTIEGHCDERGTEAYNLALGERRAQSIKTFMANAGIDKSRLNTISYGKEKPVDPSHNEAAWAKNRRGHFRID